MKNTSKQDLRRRPLLVIGFIGLMTDCAATPVVPPVRDVAGLSENEGLLLLVLNSPHDGLTRFFFKGSNGSIETPGFPKGTHSMLLVVPQGEYQMTSTYIGAVKSCRQAN